MAQCLATLTFYMLDGVTINPNGFAKVTAAYLSGTAISGFPRTFPANSSGAISFSVTQGATIWVYADVVGLREFGVSGVSLTVPASTTADLLTFAGVQVPGATNGLGSLNGLSTTPQVFATGTANSDFTITSSGSTHTFDIPDASATARGLVTTGAQTVTGIKSFASRINIGTSTPAFDQATNVLAVSAHFQYASDITVSANTVYNHIRMSRTGGEYNVFAIGDTGVVSGTSFYLEAKSTSHAASALYGSIGALSNKGPGSVKGLYARTIAQTGCTGVNIALVGACEALSGTTDWIGQLSGSDNTNYAIRIHHDVALGSTANFNGGVEFQKTVRMESGGAFFRAYGTAAHTGDFLSYLDQSDAVLFKVDKDGNLTAANFSAGGSSNRVVISSQTASNSASIVFTSGLDSTYDRYVIELDSITCQTDDKQLQMVIGTGAGPTYQTGAGAYSWSQTSEIAGLDVQSGNSADTQMLLTQPTGGTTALGNASGENFTGTIFFSDPDASSHFTNFSWQTSYNRALDSLAYHSMGGGFYKTATPITALKFLFDAGQIVSGRITLIGVKHS